MLLRTSLVARATLLVTLLLVAAACTSEPDQRNANADGAAPSSTTAQSESKTAVQSGDIAQPGPVRADRAAKATPKAAQPLTGSKEPATVNPHGAPNGLGGPKLPLLAIGAACTGGPGQGDCDPGEFCVDGVCCNSQCGSGAPNDCQACNLPTLVGTCSPTTGNSCSDSDSCTQTDVCAAGTCTGSNPVICAAPDACHDAGTCNPGTGVCSNPEKADGAACTDGNACSQTDSCQTGDRKSVV